MLKKTTLTIAAILISLNLKAWWDPGHLVVAMIAYLQLDEQAKEEVDELVKVLQRDYPYVNHFAATGPWPDDLKAEGVRTFDTWHYTNLPYNTSGVALNPNPMVNVVWAINQMEDVLLSPKARPVDKARHLAFLVHFVGDIHQPLHSTSVHNNDLPGGNLGGNIYPLDSQRWRNLHALWDSGCGYLANYNNINPYGSPKEALTKEEIDRLWKLAEEIIALAPKEEIVGLELMDPDFWALESHKLAIKYGYQGVNEIDENGREIWLKPNMAPSRLYLKNGQEVVVKRLATAGYRLGAMLNSAFGE
ncbi:MAG: S1/P1 nuclease [Saprospiraceae bacterium]|nr:S1/P1 nuclease [Saprospiraceae bacterium]